MPHVRGKMFCDRCERPVLGTRNWFRGSDVGRLAAAPWTLGLSLAGARNAGYWCPTCGGHVHRIRRWGSGEGAMRMLALGLVAPVLLSAWLAVAAVTGVVLVVAIPVRHLAGRSEPTAVEHAMRCATAATGRAVGWLWKPRTTTVPAST